LDSDPYAAFNVVQAIANLGQQAIDGLLAAMSDDNPCLRAAAAKALGYMPSFSDGTPDVSTTAVRLQQLLEDKNERVVFEAANAFWSLINQFPWFDRSVSEAIIIDSLTANTSTVMIGRFDSHPYQ
jgi:HEAT repeat protein